jgi:hypothetical protein
MASCNYCRAELTFNDAIVSQRSGKKIPLSLNGDPHRCGAWEVQHIRYYPCRNNCGAKIYFDENQKSKNDKWVPIDAETGAPHKCPDLDFDV